jgi:hypothetical protein
VSLQKFKNFDFDMPPRLTGRLHKELSLNWVRDVDRVKKNRIGSVVPVVHILGRHEEKTADVITMRNRNPFCPQKNLFLIDDP